MQNGKLWVYGVLEFPTTELNKTYPHQEMAWSDFRGTTSHSLMRVAFDASNISHL